MLLRFRILLIFFCATLLSAVLVGVPAWVAIQSADDTQDEATLASQNLLWLKCLEIGGGPYRSLVADLAAQPELARRIADGDFRTLSTWLASYGAEQSTGRVPVDRIDVVSASGRLVASSAGVSVEEPMVDAVGVARQLASSGILIGAEMDTSQRLLVVVSKGLPDGFFITVSGQFAPIVAAFAGTLKTDAFLLTSRAQPLSATSAAAWPGPAPGTALDDDVVLHVSADAKRLALVPSSITNSVGSLIALVYTQRDTTREMHRRLLLACIAVALVSALLAVLTMGLNSYLRGALLPLKEVRNALRALQRGDTLAFLDPPPRTDEIGEMVATTEHYRQMADEKKRKDFAERLSADS